MTRKPIASLHRPGALAALAVALHAGLAWAADAPPPEAMARQAAALTRALAYDANLAGRAGASVSLAIVYPRDNVASQIEAQQWQAQFANLEKLRVLGLPFRVLRLPYQGPASLLKAIEAEGLDAIFVCPGLEAEAAAIRKITRQRKVVSMASREDMVRGGLSIGVFLVNDKNTLLVNLPASREEGAQFSAELLSLARVLR